MNLKRRFALLNKGPDTFLSIGMSGTGADALSFQLQLGFQGVIEGIGHQFFRPCKRMKRGFRQAWFWLPEELPDREQLS